MIRAGTPSDLNAAVSLLRASHSGAGFNRPDGPTGFCFPFDESYAARLYLNYISGPMVYCGLYEAGGVVGGVLLAHAYEYHLGPVRLAQERVWWIDPAFRGRGAHRMLDAYEAWAASSGCTFAGMAGMGDDPVVMKLYRRRGYGVAETHCLKRL